MLTRRSDIKHILVISLTNIGDVILTMPVMDILRRDFPQARLSVVIGPKARSLFENNADFQNVYIFNKHQPFFRSFEWIVQLRKQKFDLIVDLRNSAIPFFLWPKYRTSFFDNKEERLHMRQKHLYRLKEIYRYDSEADHPLSLHVPFDDQAFVFDVIKKEIGYDRYVVIAPGAASPDKRWSKDGFAKVANELNKAYRLKIVLVGDENDKAVAQDIQKMMAFSPVDLCGRLTLVQLAELMRSAFFCLCNDSAPMHLASYLNVPVLALFGPTDPKKYGPWGGNSLYIKKDDRINSIAYEDVLRALKITKDGVTFVRED